MTAPVSPRALRWARLRARHTVAQAAAIVYASERSWRRWEIDPDAPIPQAEARLYAAITGQGWPLAEPPEGAVLDAIRVTPLRAARG